MQPSTLDFSGDGPKILIVHTHASEAYTPEPGFTYEPSDTLRTQDETRSVIRLGSEIARILEDAGIDVYSLARIASMSADRIEFVD